MAKVYLVEPDDYIIGRYVGEVYISVEAAIRDIKKPYQKEPYLSEWNWVEFDLDKEYNEYKITLKHNTKDEPYGIYMPKSWYITEYKIKS